jgi:mannose-1-phosphate guanylyltransferase
MIVETVQRIGDIIPRDRVIIVAGEEHENAIKKLLPDVRLLLEPFGKNTACAIAYAATCMNEDDIMVILPADHHIPDQKLFSRTLEKAIRVAREGHLVTFGIIPTRAETGYGYIELGEMLREDVYKVKSFKEKPNQKQAQRFFRGAGFLWNSGMFVWQQGKMLSEVKNYLPEFFKLFADFQSEKISLLDLYEKAPSISVDYAVMEKSIDVAVVRSHFVWDDIGSWLALERMHKTDSRGNTKIGLHKGMGTTNCTIVSDDGVICTIGTSDLIIVRSGDAVFVCDKRRVGDIKKLVHQMSQSKKFKKFL